MLSRLFALSPRARQFWLVVWLMPYLFLSAAGEALHHHGAFTENGAKIGVVAHSDFQSNGECLVCQWQSQSLSGVWQPNPFALPNAPRETEFRAVFPLPRFAPIVAPFNRGPPVFL